jgi:hypothetical protein
MDLTEYILQDKKYIQKFGTEALMTNWKTDRRQEYSIMTKLTSTCYQTGKWMNWLSIMSSGRLLCWLC